MNDDGLKLSDADEALLDRAWAEVREQDKWPTPRAARTEKALERAGDWTQKAHLTRGSKEGQR